MELKRNQRRPLAGMTLAELQNVVAGLEMPKFVAKQIAQWLYVKRVTTFEEMTNISKANRDRLAAEYKVGLSKPTKRTVSQDGTAKYLFDVGDGKSIEAVYIPDEDRHTLCISSQKGCRMNCYFCMTGRQGFHGNLTSNQIINQIEILTEPWGMAWSPKRVTVSTVGKKPELKVLAEKTSVHIAVSVHNAVHDERESLMPLEKIYPIKDVMQMLGQYDFAHQRRLSVEYIMWQWFNDDIKHAEALREILPDEHVRVNLIRYHMIPDVAKLRTSSDERMTAFRDYLNGRGVMCTIRRSRGEDIAAACGMLAGKVNNAAEKAEKPEKAVKPAKAEKPAKATKAEKPAKATRASKKK